VPSTEVQFEEAVYAQQEAEGEVTIAVALDRPVDRSVVVRYATADGSAAPGEDYQPVSGTLRFEAGDEEQELTVPVYDDAVYEGDETLYVALRDPEGAVLGARDRAAVTIRDNEPPPGMVGRVVLNEVLPVAGETDWNGDGVADARDEWIEIHSRSVEAIDLSEWTLLDRAGEASSYQIAEGTVLEPNGFLVLYRSQTGVALNDGGDTVRLENARGDLIDLVEFGELPIDVSYSRVEDEESEWEIRTFPSPGLPNARGGAR
jgi:hypothetical protein